jgi:hypothetical protein
VIDPRPQLRPSPATAGGQIIETGTELGAAKHGVGDHADKHRDGDDISEGHCTGSKWCSPDTAATTSGPYELGRSSSLARQRLAIDRNTT